MRKYTAAEIEKFLISIDGFLERKVMVIIIGGTAAALAYKVSKATQDIDTLNSVQGLESAYEQAKAATGLEIELGKVSVSDAPYDFEDRLQLYRPEIFKKLIVYVPEVADLILMKTLRGYAHDLEAIEEMVKNENVNSQTLINRYVRELSVAVGDKRKLDLNFLAMIAQCYGDDVAAKAERELKK